jgi:rRNA maturation RNase YbeY
MMTPPLFDLSIRAYTGREHVPYLRRHLPQAHALLKPPLRELSLALVGDKRMSQLHQEFMGISGPTDVMTFPLDEDARGRPLSGEVIVCVPEAARQSRRLGTTIQQELLLYALHGMLHLSGFDDRTPSAYRKMHAKEDEILTKLGVGRTFAPARKAGR